jgi:hypothetical protein
MNERIGRIRQEIAALKAKYYVILDKEERSKSQQYKMDNFDKELTRLQGNYTALITALANAPAPTRGTILI